MRYYWSIIKINNTLANEKMTNYLGGIKMGKSNYNLDEGAINRNEKSVFDGGQSYTNFGYNCFRVVLISLFF